MLSKELELVLNMAMRYASSLRHEYLTVETLFLKLFETDKDVINVIKGCGGDVDSLKEELTTYIEDISNFSIRPELPKNDGEDFWPELSLMLQRVLNHALFHMQSSGKKEIRGVNILEAVYKEENNHVKYLLELSGVDHFGVIKEISHSLDGPETEKSASSPQSQTILDSFTKNLNEMAKRGEIDQVIGREKELTRIFQTLCRRKKNNPLIVGDPGVGKTALGEGIACKIVAGSVPEVLKKCVIYKMNMADIVSGTKYRGDFEQRFQNIIKELLEKRKNGECEPILFIDDIHGAIGAGSIGGGSLDGANMLRPLLSSGDIRCIGTCSYDEYRKFIEKDAPFGRRFQKIDLEEPSEDETLKIITGIKDKLEAHHNVGYSEAIIKLAIELSLKHINDRLLPDKAIDVLDEVGALLRIQKNSSEKVEVSRSDIEQIISQMGKIPQKQVVASENKILETMSSHIKTLIFGQDEAVDRCVDAVILCRAGLAKDEGTMANFLFAGPTGVGKTELAKQISAHLGINFVRFDMSEYMEKHSVAKLIGAPPGYVGYEQGGLLTDEIKKNPYSLLLLDEIEKAHHDIYNILLQVMDSGHLTDSQGRRTDFSNVILIMTTNAGAIELESGQIGIKTFSSTDGMSKMTKAIKTFFSPEFRNRLDEIIYFKSLGDEMILRVVGKFIAHLSKKLAQKSIILDVNDEVLRWIAKNGFSSRMGARPIQRLIDKSISAIVSKALLFGNLGPHMSVEIKISSLGELMFTYKDQ